MQFTNHGAEDVFQEMLRMHAQSPRFDPHQAVTRVWWYHHETQALSKFFSLIYSFIFFKKKKNRAGEMEQWLRALANLP